ncbi:hypothetical protein [Actinokineospora sp. NPDC004072]
MVAEAKGRSSGVESTLRSKIVAQKRSVSSINGSPPWIAFACVAHFPRPAGHMRLSAFDPEEDDIETVALEISMDRFMLAYYTPFVRVIELGDAEEDSSADMASFGPLGPRAGLPHRLRQRINSAERGELDGLYEDVQQILERARERFQRPDGTIIATNWDEAMRIEGQEWFSDTDFE